MKYYNGKTILITGASAGLGKAFAIELAEVAEKLILVARRMPQLEEVAALCRAVNNKIVIELATADLNQESDRKQLIDRYARKSTILINNAGFDHFGDIFKYDFAIYEKMIELNVLALTQLTHAFGLEMIKRKSGGILNISSVGMISISPKSVIYHATKSYVSHFTEGAHHALKPHGVNCTAFCPGATATDFYKVSGTSVAVNKLMPAKQAAQLGLAALARNDKLVFPGLLNNLMYLGSRLVPRSWIPFFFKLVFSQYLVDKREWDRA
ncbi:MAG: SDR family NAD(P)-dependent oxidoreductase [Aquabacterium sp.]|nr:SDR family NAD(P)-dependent oxidoreductase [Aquabacterium sp.]